MAREADGKDVQVGENKTGRLATIDQFARADILRLDACVPRTGDASGRVQLSEPVR
ncbi:hypothetical protein D3C86_2102290 [compost metagenome]